jgi:hypothetical protein
VDHIDQLLAVKTRLTTIKGYARLIERDIDRMQPRPERLGARIAELNSEIRRLVELVARIESSMTDAEGVEPPIKHTTNDDYISAGC